MTMHHVDSEEVSEFWDFERRHYSSQDKPKPLLMKDVFYELILPRLRPVRRDWDNWAKQRYYLNRNESRWDEGHKEGMKPEEEMTEEEKVAYKSPEACAAACHSVSADECLRWRFRDGYCVFDNTMILGSPTARAGERKTACTAGGTSTVS